MAFPETRTGRVAWRVVGGVWRGLLLLTLALAPAVACQDVAADAGQALPDAVEAFWPGEHVLELEHGGLERRALVRVPPPTPDAGAEESAPVARPVLLAFHGGGGHAGQFKQQVALEALADAERFVLVFPDGSGPFARRLHTWNAGTCCGAAVAEGVDDVGFVRALVEALARRTDIDRTRIYATGFSNGGMLAWRLAAEAPDLVAAVAPVGGGLVTPIATAGPPVPVLHIHSVDDPRALYGGGLGPPFPLTDKRQQHPDMAAVLAAWAARDGLASEPVEVETRTRDGHTATRLEWRPAAPSQDGGDGGDGGEAGEAGTAGNAARPEAARGLLVHWRLTGAGHAWPGAVGSGRERIAGPATSVLDANREIWDFVSRFRRVPTPPSTPDESDAARR